jgi:hypothetical protein
VWIVREGAARRVEVAEGFGQDSFVEVVPAVAAELVAGDPVVVVGARDLAEGDEVKVDLEELVPGAEPVPEESASGEAEPEGSDSAQEPGAASETEPR